jgi:hypothetical protein
MLKKLTIILFLCCFLLPISAEAGNRKLGETCANNHDCLSGDCEKSNLSAGVTDFCVCKTSNDCEYTFGKESAGEVWTCENGTPMSKNLHFCQSTTQGSKYPIDKSEKEADGKDEGEEETVIISDPPMLAIPIPGLPKWSSQEIKAGQTVTVSYLADYVISLYRYGVVLGSIFAVAALMIGGILFLSAAGMPGNVEKAKTIIFGALTGLVLLLASYLILNIINPNLTNPTAIKVDTVEPVPAIDFIEEGGSAAPYTGSLSHEPSSVPDYKQFASPWGSTKYGYNSSKCDCKKNPAECGKVSSKCCTTIHQAGCGPTSLAMVLSSYGSGITPDKVSQFSGIKGNGRVCNTGTNIGSTINKLYESPWGMFTGKKVSKSEALEHLKNKKPIIFLCKGCSGTGNSGPKSYNGHYMVLKNLNASGLIEVHDPGSNNTKAIRIMTKTQLDKNGGFWYVHPK